MRDNAWFEGFAPRSAPEIVVVCLFEHGEHGQFAAPIVRDVMVAYFNKKTRLAALEQEKQAIQARVAGMTNLGMPGPRRPWRRPRPRTQGSPRLIPPYWSPPFPKAGKSLIWPAIFPHATWIGPCC